MKKVQAVERDSRHWSDENYSQRMTTAQWRRILLEEQDVIIACGRTRRLVAKNLGAGVVEVRKEPLRD